LISLATLGGIITYEAITQTRTDYFNTSTEQMKIVEKSINIFYDQIDKNINMMASNPLVMQSSKWYKIIRKQ
jgi:methyl-accepting chemotaxis protein